MSYKKSFLNSTFLFTFFPLFPILQLAAQNVTFDKWEVLTEQSKMPPEVQLQHSNNNLDLVKFHNTYYVAFRTAPTHFASRKTKIYIISSTDLKKWNYEYTIALKCDLREPRFAILKDSLYLYFFSAGTNMFLFEPKEVLVTVTAGNKHWTEPASVGLDGFVPWRVRNRNDTLWLSAYYGKELYTKTNTANLRLLISRDGRHFNPISKEPQATITTSEEGEFIFDKQNNLYATVRLEGYGSLICSARKDSLDKWHYKRYKYKYDSALLFDHNDDIYLISRRNLDGPVDKSTYPIPDENNLSTPAVKDTTDRHYPLHSANGEGGRAKRRPGEANGGNKMDGGTVLSNTKPDSISSKHPLQITEVPITDHKKHTRQIHSTRTNNLIRYSITRKRTALFKFDKENLIVDHVIDFPSTGDCSYPAIQRLNENDYLVMNYSSDIHKKEKNWIRGQLGKTYIYWTILHFK